jgi:hypothetical protein
MQPILIIVAFKDSLQRINNKHYMCIYVDFEVDALQLFYERRIKPPDAVYSTSVTSIDGIIFVENGR